MHFVIIINTKLC